MMPPPVVTAGPGSSGPRNVRIPSRLVCDGRGKGSVAGLWPMAMVWPCPLTVDACVVAGREVEVARLGCPSCGGPMVLWPGYWRHVRAAGRCRRIFVPRERCGPCRVSHALLPAFVLAWRLDTAETAGAVIAEVVSRSEEHTSELQSRVDLVCRLLLEKKK